MKKLRGQAGDASCIVPPKYPDRSVIIEVDRLSFTSYGGAASLAHRGRHPCLDVEDFG